jgi:hypothetical protein
MTQCRLIINDEVNVKIEGLDVNTRRTLTNRFKYEIPGARYLPAVRLGRWDGKVSYFSLAGATYINLLPDIIPILEDLGYDIDIADTRNYTTSYKFSAVNEHSFSDHVWPEGHTAQGQPILLRDYQCDIINRFLTTPQCIQEVATGAGKTVMTAALSRSVQDHGRSIVIVPNKSLVTQTESDYRNLGLDVGVYYGDRKEPGHQHTICTWQSLNVLLKNTRSGITDVTIGDFIENVVCVMVDECFDESSKVLTTNGYVPIKDIKIGDKVINYCEKSKEFKVDTVVKQHKNLTNSESEKMYELIFDTNTIIRVTGNHKFLTTEGWVRADQLTENHEIIETNINTFN